MFLELLKEYIMLNLNDYFEGADFPITIFILSIAVGICIACVFITINKRNMFFLIQALTRYEAYSEEAAKTISELKLKAGFFLKRSLSSRGQLSSIVGMVGGYPYENSGTIKSRIDFSAARFFIKPGENSRAMKISDTAPPSYINTALGCVLILMIFVTFSLFLPRILEFLTGIL